MMMVFWIIAGGALAGFALNRAQGHRYQDVVAVGMGVAITLTIYLALTILPTVLSAIGYLILLVLLAIVGFGIYVFFTRER